MDNLITMAESVREASRKLALENSDKKNAALAAMADALIARKDYILKANARDIERGRSNGMSEALLDRLALSESRINGMAGGCETAYRTARSGWRGHRELRCAQMDLS